MENDKKAELATDRDTAVSLNLLGKNGVEMAMPFSRDIFLMNTMINGAI